GLLAWALAPLLEGRRVEYHYTDVGRSFLVQAERQAAERGYGFMRFGTLDIDRDPAAQGYATGSFDVVLALNVMHVTPRVERALAHAAALLQPAGSLLLIESVRPMRWVDMIWGLTEGWWHYEDT